MALQPIIEHRAGYTVVRVEGAPTLDQFLAFLREVAAASGQWPNDRAMFDLRGIRTLTSFTEHYTVGQETGRHFQHLKQLASVVPPDRITRASETTARQAGVNLAVFTDEGSAIAWLQT